MKKLYQVTALILTLAATLLAGILAHAIFFMPEVWLATSSPNKTYRVELTGQKSRAFYHVVRFNLIKNGQTVVKNAYAHSGDWMDISFELAYPEHAWVSENVLRFWRKSDAPESKSDILLISNDTDEVIRYLKVNSEEMFLIFDMQPRAGLKLTFPRQSERSWIAVEGEFEDGQRIGGNGVNFTPGDRLSEPWKYCANVSYGHVRIGSPHMEGYDLNGNWEKPNVPKATDCNP